MYILEILQRYSDENHRLSQKYIIELLKTEYDIRAERHLISEIIDWFGKDVNFYNADDEYVDVTVSVNENAVFYWSLQYGQYVEILSPASLRESVANAAKRIHEKYH